MPCLRALRNNRYGSELWRTDGTAAGTWLVSDVTPGRGISVGEHFSTEDDLFFSSCLTCDLFRLWRSDGSHEGTVPGPLLYGLDQCVNFPSTEYPALGVAAGDRFFFTQWSEELGRELWVSDGTPGSLEVFDLQPGPDSSHPGRWVASNDIALFATRGGVHDYLWASDGTEQGTVLLAGGNLLLGDGYSVQLGDVLLYGIPWYSSRQMTGSTVVGCGPSHKRRCRSESRDRVIRAAVPVSGEDALSADGEERNDS